MSTGFSSVNSEFSQQYRRTRDLLRLSREYLVRKQAGLAPSAEQCAAWQWFESQLQEPRVQAQILARIQDKKIGP